MKRLIAGVDVGNQTTEVALAKIAGDGAPRFLAASIAPTTGIKGTFATLDGVRAALAIACAEAGAALESIAELRLNAAVPVVAGVAMQAITSTVLTDSALLGHNPGTPGGIGLAVGRTIAITDLAACVAGDGPMIALIPAEIAFDRAATLIMAARAAGADIVGAVAQADDGVLIANRLRGTPIPIVDEVHHLERAPLGQIAAIEVAPPGGTVQRLCNPYGLAALFGLDTEATARIAPAAAALTGLRSAVVIRLPPEVTADRRIEAGSLVLHGRGARREVEIRAGAAAIMRAQSDLGELRDADGTSGTSVGAMFAAIRAEIAEGARRQPAEIRIRDLLAADLSTPQPLHGGLGNEIVSEQSVALAAMVQADATAGRVLAEWFSAQLGMAVTIAGSEGAAGIRGALTTPGVGAEVCVLDLGSGSTNGARVDGDGRVAVVHLAGGGSLVDLLIGEELGIADPWWREAIKRNRAAHVGGFFTLRHEDGEVQFLDEPVAPDLFGRTVLLRDGALTPIPGNPPLDRVVALRRRAKTAVFGVNVERALRALAPGGNPRFLHFIALIGGSALDFELPGMLAQQVAQYGLVCGAADIRGSLGPRNAVATGLLLSPPADVD